MKKILIPIALLLCLFAAIYATTEQEEIDVTIHSRVDTTQSEIKEIAELWVDYLNSQQDNVRHNPHLNTAEKLRYRNVDFSIPYLFQIPTVQLPGFGSLYINF